MHLECMVTARWVDLVKVFKALHDNRNPRVIIRLDDDRYNEAVFGRLNRLFEEVKSLPWEQVERIFNIYREGVEDYEALWR